MRRLVLSAAFMLWQTSASAQTQGSDLSAGGLAPPPAVESEGDKSGAPAQTQADLERSDREDSGRGLSFVWLEGEVGIGHYGLQTVDASDLIDASVPASQTGLVLGAGLGLRLVFVTAGVRFRYAALPEWQLWNLGAEAGIHMQLGSVEPYATLGLGYIRAVGIQADPTTSTGAGGFDARLALGLDYFFTNIFSAGVNVSGDFFTLSRSAVEGAGQPGGPPSVYAEDGSSLGAGVTATAVFGLHF